MIDVPIYLKIILVVIAFLVGWGIRYIIPAFKYQPQVEEVVEDAATEVIKKESGIDVDFIGKKDQAGK